MAAGPRTTTRPRHGLTLIEVVLSSIVLAVLAAAGLRTLAASADRRERVVARSAGSLLADQLMAEAMALPFMTRDFATDSEFGRSAAEVTSATWGSFDDCDDFHGWSASPPQDAGGVAIAGFEGYTPDSVVVDYVSPTSPGVVSGSATGLKRITVTVERAGRPVATVVGYRSKAGSTAQEE